MSLRKSPRAARKHGPALLFASPEAAAATRRLLLISYHFPPGQATGALRWQKLAPLLAERGWALDVVTADPSSLGKTDPARLAGLPPGTRVFGAVKPVPAIDRWERIVWRWLRAIRRSRQRPQAAAGAAPGASATPDPTPQLIDRHTVRWRLWTPSGLKLAYHAWRDIAQERAWADRAFAVARQVTAGREYHLVASCGPPHMAHDAGRRMAERLGVPFVMDLRDPWSLSPVLARSFASPLWPLLAARVERAAAARASLIVTNTPPLAEAMERAYGELGPRVISVLNGCDDDLRIPRRVSPCFTVAYAGNIYIDRDPRLFFRAAGAFVRRHRLGPQDFAIELVGHVSEFQGRPVTELAAEEGIGDYVHCIPHRPRLEAMERLAGAAVLLSLPQGVDLAIPSKLFDYFQLQAWVLGLATRGSATERLLRETPADVVDPLDVAGMEAVLSHRYEQFRQGEAPPRIADDPRLGRRFHALRLLDALDECVPPRPALEVARLRRAVAAEMNG